jgi:hypothetical protein
MLFLILQHYFYAGEISALRNKKKNYISDLTPLKE